LAKGNLFALALVPLAVYAAQKLIPVTMQLDWKPNVQFAGLLLAKEKGYYAEAGLDVTLRPVDTEMKVSEDVATGTHWIGCSECHRADQNQPLGEALAIGVGRGGEHGAGAFFGDGGLERDGGVLG